MIEWIIYPVIIYILGAVSGFSIYRGLENRRKRMFWKDFLRPIKKETRRDEKIRKLVTEFRKKSRMEQSDILREWADMVTGKKHGLPLSNFTKLVEDSGIDVEEIRNG